MKDMKQNLSDLETRVLKLSTEINCYKITKSLIEKGYLEKDGRLTEKGINCTLYAGRTREELEELGKKLIDIFPKGLKSSNIRGTVVTIPWAQPPRLIAEDFVQFFRYYGDDYTDEQIIQATEKYVHDYIEAGKEQYLCTLKYYIFKEYNGKKESALYNAIVSLISGGTSFNNDGYIDCDLL